MSCFRCKSAAGTPKQVFKSFDHAYTVMNLRGWDADVYPCPHQKNRYHLTHKKETK